jgi:hypothetical protein
MIHQVAQFGGSPILNAPTIFGLKADASEIGTNWNGQYVLMSAHAGMRSWTLSHGSSRIQCRIPESAAERVSKVSNVIHSLTMCRRVYSNDSIKIPLSVHGGFPFQKGTTISKMV